MPNVSFLPANDRINGFTQNFKFLNVGGESMQQGACGVQRKVALIVIKLTIFEIKYNLGSVVSIQILNCFFF